ncbi:MAG: hypothetical protein HC880_11365 [Bacteroidia bacterium]|nr:hypothetical protein [Bacteroidia bacterium]
MDLYRYFQSYHDYFWQWDDGAEVIVVPGGSTIAYRAFVVEILKKLSGQGIPPLGSLLLTLIATNADADENLNALFVKLITNHRDPDEVVSRAISFLKLLPELPSFYKEGPRRILLLQALFSESHNSLSARKAQAIFRQYARHEYIREEITTPQRFNERIYYNDFRVIALLGGSFPLYPGYYCQNG